MKTVFYATIDAELGVPIAWKFQVKERKDGGFKAERYLPFLGYSTIINKHQMTQCGSTAEEAIEKMRKRKLQGIEQAKRNIAALTEDLESIEKHPVTVMEYPFNPNRKENA